MNGGIYLFQYAGEDVAVAMINCRLSSLNVLNVLPDHRKHGLGQAVVAYLRPNFARVIESAVPFFERCGYVCVGCWHQGRRLRTIVMVRDELRSLVGRLRKAFARV